MGVTRDVLEPLSGSFRDRVNQFLKKKLPPVDEKHEFMLILTY